MNQSDPPTPSSTTQSPSESNSHDELLSVLQQAFRTITSYQIQNNIVQANAEGFSVKVFYSSSNNDNSNDNEVKEEYLFVKTVDASKYAHKPWGDLRRTLLYSRTEARFYSKILPLLLQSSSSGSSGAIPSFTPKCFLAETSLDGLIREDESAMALPTKTTSSNTSKKSNNDNTAEEISTPNYDTSNTTILQGKGGNLILQALHPPNAETSSVSKATTYIQTSPLSTKQVLSTLTSLAQFHAMAYEQTSILSIASQELSPFGGSYNLQIRNPKEYANLISSWKSFMNAFKNVVPVGFFEKESIVNLGRRVYDLAEFICHELSPRFDEPYATIVHGDYKAMNIFLPVGSNSNEDDIGQAIMIDWACSGIGIGMSDVAMHLTHALTPAQLTIENQEFLIQHYLTTFHKSLPESTKMNGIAYTKEIAMRHYQLATIDYFRFILGRFYKNSTPESFEKKKDSENTTLVNRNLDAAVAFIERVDNFLTIVEQERE